MGTIAHIIRYLHIRYLCSGKENGKSLLMGLQMTPGIQAKAWLRFSNRISTTRQHRQQGLAVLAVTCLKGQDDFNLLYRQPWSSPVMLYVQHIHLLLSNQGQQPQQLSGAIGE